MHHREPSGVEAGEVREVVVERAEVRYAGPHEGAVPEAGDQCSPGAPPLAHCEHQRVRRVEHLPRPPQVALHFGPDLPGWGEAVLRRRLLLEWAAIPRVRVLLLGCGLHRLLRPPAAWGGVGPEQLGHVRVHVAQPLRRRRAASAPLIAVRVLGGRRRRRERREHGVCWSRAVAG